ncbi:uncharacterized protein LOC125234911 [Leguminivora glycinivorella]|uniref:uncharacterized protein LOC125234911 n=1 Tax=Leguminivora glycinivorella TaxID=1035111 RepID=UPI00200DB03E|nr:uncharacterized protein LOC125234911 [Leguminivora glycinivorella]
MLPLRAKVVTVVTNPIPDLSNITMIAWKYDITDLIILIQNENQSEMYTFYPYSNNSCGNTSPIKVHFKENFFPSKFKNLFGCQTRLGTWEAAAMPYIKVNCVNGSSPFFKGIFALVALLKIINKTERINKSLQIAWNTLAILLGQDAKFVTKSRLMNFLFMIWIWFSIVITTAYNGLLVKMLVTKILEPRFDTIENAVHLVNGYGGAEWYKEWFRGTPVFHGYEDISLVEEVENAIRISQGKSGMQGRLAEQSFRRYSRGAERFGNIYQ